MFKAGKTQVLKKIKKNGKNIYAVEVMVNKNKKAKLENVKKHVERIREEIKKKYPDVTTSVSIKYESMAHYISGGFVMPDQDIDLRAPYDYSGDNDHIESFYVQYTL